MKNLSGFKIDFESTDKVLPLHQHLWSKISRQWNNSPLIFFFFEICTKEGFASYILSNEENIKTSILLMLLKCIVVGYSNGNKSFTGRLFSNYRLLNMLFHFFSFIVFFTTLLSRVLWRKYPFSAQISKLISRCCILQKVRMPNFVILKWRPFEYKVTTWTICPF